MPGCPSPRGAGHRHGSAGNQRLTIPHQLIPSVFENQRRSAVDRPRERLEFACRSRPPPKHRLIGAQLPQKRAGHPQKPPAQPARFASVPTTNRAPPPPPPPSARAIRPDRIRARDADSWVGPSPTGGPVGSFLYYAACHPQPPIPATVWRRDRLGGPGRFPAAGELLNFDGQKPDGNEFTVRTTLSERPGRHHHRSTKPAPPVAQASPENQKPRQFQRLPPALSAPAPPFYSMSGEPRGCPSLKGRNVKGAPSTKPWLPARARPAVPQLLVAARESRGWPTI